MAVGLGLIPPCGVVLGLEWEADAAVVNIRGFSAAEVGDRWESGLA